MGSDGVKYIVGRNRGPSVANAQIVRVMASCLRYDLANASEMTICCDATRYLVSLYEGLKSACRADLWRYESCSVAREFSHVAYIRGNLARSMY